MRENCLKSHIYSTVLSVHAMNIFIASTVKKPWNQDSIVLWTENQSGEEEGNCSANCYLDAHPTFKKMQESEETKHSAEDTLTTNAQLQSDLGSPKKLLFDRGTFSQDNPYNLNKIFVFILPSFLGVLCVQRHQSRMIGNWKTEPNFVQKLPKNCPFSTFS